ncbi:MAG TPA: DedA family protein [Chromobacteriaceae bacterium]|nr:DedA family protein [Chromobacteriaceae bacterium]
MDALTFLLDFILHIDVHLAHLVAQYGVWIYAILFAILFCETGLVITPFLPGDSLLFVAGALAAMGKMDVHLLTGSLILAGVLGNTVNYTVGRYLGNALLQRYPKLIKPEYLAKTHAFYDKHGGKTIIFTRFVPIIRTFAPFVAGIGSMGYRQFTLYNVAGAALWVAGFCYAGYFFGNLPFVRKNLELLIFGIIFVSFLPAIIEFWRHKRQAKPQQ